MGVPTPQPFWHESARVYIPPLYAKFPLVRAVESSRSPRWRSSLALQSDLRKKIQTHDPSIPVGPSASHPCKLK